MAGVFSATTKTMLKNVIRHTTSHNKVVEESEMWQQRGRMKTLGCLDPSNPSYGHDDRCDSSNSRHRNGDYWNSKSAKRSQLSTVGHSRHAHMDDDVETRDEKPASSTSTYWMRQLDKLETGDPNRWDHSGFKEMYPHDFNSDRSDSPSRPLKSANRKRKKNKSTTKKKKRHRSKSKKHRSKDKKSSRHHRDLSSCSESDTDSSAAYGLDRREKRRHSYKVKKHLQGKARARRDFSSESSSSESMDYKSRRNQSKSKKRHKDRSKSRRDFSSGSSSESDSDSESQRNCHKPKKRRKHRSQTRSDSSRGSGSESVSSADKRTSRKHGHKMKSKKRRKEGHQSSKKKAKIFIEPENRLVVELWKEANGIASSSKNGDFDKRFEKEVSHQYHSLKRKYSQVDREKT